MGSSSTRNTQEVWLLLYPGGIAYSQLVPVKLKQAQVAQTFPEF